MRSVVCDACKTPIPPEAPAIVVLRQPDGRRLDLCKDCAADMLDLLDGCLKGKATCPYCGGGLVLLPRAPDKNRLADACETVSHYVRERSTGMDGYEIGLCELATELTATFLADWTRT
jgi:hypothetical protein